MGTMGKVTVDLEARSAGWTKGLNNAGNDVKGFVRNAERDFKNLSFENGVGGFAKVFTGYTRQAEEFTTKLRTGATIAETFGGIVNNIPIVGPFKQAGEAIREMWSGTRAERIELEKMTSHLNEMAKAYREIKVSEQLRGKYGNEKRTIELEAEADNKISEISAQIVAKQQELDDFEKKVGSSNGLVSHLLGAAGNVAAGLDSDSIKKERKRLNGDLEQLRGTRDEDQKKHGQVMLDQQRDIDHTELENARQKNESLLSISASGEEKSLRRQGKALESAIAGYQATTNAGIRANFKDLDPYETAGLSSDAKLKRLLDDLRVNFTLQDDFEKTKANLKFEGARKESEIAKDNTEEVTKIKAEANIEQLNAMGKTHEAERAKIEENYRASIVAMEKKQREENRLMDTNKSDPTLLAAESAAGMRRFNSLQNESFKTRQDNIKKERELWERVGGPVEKYYAQLANINDEFKLLGDSRLRDLQVGKLDADTFKAIQSLNPTHDANVDLHSGFGVLGSQFLNTGGADNTAQQQLEAVKKTAAFMSQWDTYMRTLYNAANAVAGPITELSI
jgi:hypothetical protein